MAGPILNSCCRCQPLRTGSIITGVATILSAIVTLIILFTVRLQYKTILLNWLSPATVKVILAFNLCMTILISIIMIVGAIKRNYYLMLPWVVIGIMLVISLFISVIYTGVVFIIDENYVVGLISLIIGLLYAVLAAYLWTVVYSYFTILREESKKGKYNRQPYRR